MSMKIKEKTVERWFDCRFFTWNWFVLRPLNGACSWKYSGSQDEARRSRFTTIDTMLSFSLNTKSKLHNKLSEDSSLPAQLRFGKFPTSFNKNRDMLCVVVKTTSETLNKFNRQYPLRLSIVIVLADPHLYPDFLDHPLLQILHFLCSSPR